MTSYICKLKSRINDNAVYLETIALGREIADIIDESVVKEDSLTRESDSF